MKLLPFLAMVLFAISCLAQVQADASVVGTGEKVAETVNQVTDKVTATVADATDAVTKKVTGSVDSITDSVTGGKEAQKAEAEEEKKLDKDASFTERLATNILVAGVDTVASEAKKEAGSPILKPVINGAADIAKKKVRAQVRNYMRDDSEEKEDENKAEAPASELGGEGGIGEKILTVTGLDKPAQGGIGDKLLTSLGRKKRSIISYSDSAPVAQPGMVRRLFGGIKNAILGRSSTKNAAPVEPASVQVFGTTGVAPNAKSAEPAVTNSSNEGQQAASVTVPSQNTLTADGQPQQQTKSAESAQEPMDHKSEKDQVQSDNAKDREQSQPQQQPQPQQSAPIETPAQQEQSKQKQKDSNVTEPAEQNSAAEFGNRDQKAVDDQDHEEKK